MPVYQYYNDELDETIEVEMGMNEDHPKFIEKDGKSFRKIIGAGISVTIPYGFVTDHNKIQTDKSPSRKKHVY
jgi:predicted nucleic acid-binding Zn ribbon protein